MVETNHNSCLQPTGEIEVYFGKTTPIMRRHILCRSIVEIHSTLVHILGEVTFLCQRCNKKRVDGILFAMSVRVDIKFYHNILIKSKRTRDVKIVFLVVYAKCWSLSMINEEKRCLLKKSYIFDIIYNIYIYDFLWWKIECVQRKFWNILVNTCNEMF